MHMTRPLKQKEDQEAEWYCMWEKEREKENLFGRLANFKDGVILHWLRPWTFPKNPISKLISSPTGGAPTAFDFGSLII